MPVGTDYAVDLVHKIGLNPKVIFDIGANIGQTVNFYKTIYPNSTIYTFEPIPSTFSALERNCKGIVGVFPFNIAFGETTESRTVRIVKDQTSVVNSINDNFQNRLGLSEDGYDEVDIRIKTLDDFVGKEKIETIDLLKIDTEGFEVQILNGAKNLLNSGKVSAIVCEAGFVRSNTRNTYFGDINDILDGYGYALFGIYEMGHLGFKKGFHYGNLLYLSKDFRENHYKNWQFGYS